MPALVIPKLSPEMEQIGACVFVTGDNPELLAWVSANQRRATARLEGGGETRWLQLILEIWEKNEIHFHIEAFKNPPEEPGERLPADEVLRIIEAFLGKVIDEEAFVMSVAKLRVSRSDIPENGMIAGLLNFKEETCGAAFSLRSGSLEMFDQFFDKLSFRLDEGERNQNETLYLELWASANIIMGEEYLHQLHQLMTEGANCFIFERASREAANARN